MTADKIEEEPVKITIPKDKFLSLVDGYTKGIEAMSKSAEILNGMYAESVELVEKSRKVVDYYYNSYQSLLSRVDLLETTIENLKSENESLKSRISTYIVAGEELTPSEAACENSSAVIDADKKQADSEEGIRKSKFPHYT